MQDNNDYIQHRLEKSKDSFADAKLLYEHERWNASVNRLYYACFYAVNALLLTKNVETHSHRGSKTQFAACFVQTGLVDTQQNKFFADIFDLRQKGDYSDAFDFDKKSVESLLTDAETFLQTVFALIKQDTASGLQD